jgi:hypothetical protein
MITEKDTIKCEAIFNDERTHRFLWKQVWNKDKPLACVIMLNPCMADTLITDTTTFLVVNHIASLEKYGGVEIVNLYSMLTTKLNFRANLDISLNDPANDGYIKKAAEEANIVILAWGRSEDSNQRIAARAEVVLNLLEPYQKKLKVLSDGERVGMHPLTPALRSRWILEDFKASIDETLTAEE